MQNWYTEHYWDEHQAILEQLLKTPTEPESYLKTFSNVYSLVDDAWLDAYIRHCRDSSNKQASDQLEFVESKVIPRFERLFADLKIEFIAQENSAYERLINTFKVDVKGSSEVNTELNKKERDLKRSFQQLGTGNQVDLNGGISIWKAWRILNATKISEERKVLYFKILKAQYANSEEINRIYSDLTSLRKNQAKNAGFDHYADYSWHIKRRTDYSYKESVEWSTGLFRAFRKSQEKLANQLKKTHNVDPLNPWDRTPDVENNRDIPENEFKDAIISAFDSIDPEFGKIITNINKAGDLDIMSNENKTGGNFGFGFKIGNRVGVSGNTVGSISDMPVLLHECGHAIHYHYGNNLELSWDQEVTPEIAEFVAFLFQSLASNYLVDVGFISATQARQYNMVIANRILHTLRGVAERDLFEKYIYSTDKKIHPEDLGGIFLRSHFSPVYNEKPIRTTLPFMWQNYTTIITNPFSGTEYSLAWLCTFLAMDSFSEDGLLLIQKLKKLMRLGNRLSMKDSLGLLGINMPFEKADFELANRVFETHFFDQ